jgi:regulator of replication initiation timing
MSEVKLNVDLIADNLSNQIALLSKEKAIYYSMATQLTVEVNQLRQENEQLKKRIEELEKQKTETEEPTDEKSE